MTSGRWLVAIVALGAILRFFPIWFGLPYAQARPDETAALGLAVSVRSGDLNPHFFHWPSLAIYVFATLHAAMSGIRRVMGVSPELSFSELAISARAIVAAAGTLTIVVLFSMARRMGGTTIGLLAALFLAVSILHVRDSHFAMTDVLMTMLSTASLALLLRALDADASGRMTPTAWFAVSGFVGGLAASTKYSAAALMAGMAAGQLCWLGRFRNSWWRREAWMPSVAFVTAFLAGFVAGTPYAVLDYQTFTTDLLFDLTHLSGGHGVDLGRGWVYHLTTSLPYGLGIPVFLAAIAGIVPMVRHYPRHAFVVGLFGAGFYASIGSGQTVFFRYVLPLVPILCLPAAVATARGAAWAAARTGFSPAAALRVLTVAMAGVALVNCVWFDVLLSRTDSRVLGARWLATRLQAGDSLHDAGNSYTRLDLSQVRYHQWWYDSATESFGHPAGETPVWLVLYESALEPYARMPLPLLELARNRYHLVHTIPAAKARAGSAVYDLQDAFFMPVSGFYEVRRPGPTVQIYRLRDASSLFGTGDSGQNTPR
jgi:4-amino-4-deoxy-L-arabinose transferase-like glycosyltransferase